MSEIPIVKMEAPPVEVMVLEDRARVIRRGSVRLPKGATHIEVPDVAPVLSNRTLSARILHPSDATVCDVRIVRFCKALREQRPDQVQELEKSLQHAEQDLRTSERDLALLESRMKSLDRIEDLALKELEQDAAWNRDSRVEAATFIDQDIKDSHTARSEEAALRSRIAEQERDVRDLERRMALARTPATTIGARLEADVRTDAPATCEIEFSYIVPGVCWRPWHTAERIRAPKTRVLFQSDACVWQNTGEDWKDVTLRFSTERPSLGVVPPQLESDVVEARAKSPVLNVQTRGQEVQTTGLGTATETATGELPGIDDGGDVLSIAASLKADIPSDGRPYRVPYGNFEADAELERVLMPELSTAASWKTVQTNTGSLPLLAGPVDLLGDGGFIGRTQVSIAAPNERFALGWEPEAALRVHREVDRVDQESGLMGNMLTSRRTVALRLSNIGADELTVKVMERVPVSEIEQVEIGVDPKETSEGKSPDENGFVTWDVRLAPFGRQSLRLVYIVKRRKDVTGI